MNLRAHLSILVAATVLPMAAFGIAAATLIAQREVHVFERAALDRTRALMSAVDAELKGYVAALQALATSPTLDGGGLQAMGDEARRDAFVAEARRTWDAQRHWKGVALVTADGQLIADVPGRTAAEVSKDGRVVIETESFERAIRTGHPVIGDMFDLDGGRTMSIRIPLDSGGTVSSVLSARVDPRAIDSLLRTQGFAGDWVGVVVNEYHRVVSRTGNVAGATAQFVTPEFRARLAEDPSGWHHGGALAGEVMYTPFSRSAETGWTVALSIPAAVVEAVGAETRMLLFVGVLIAALVAFIVAQWMIPRIAGPIVSLAGMAEELPTGVPAPPRHAARVREVHDVSRALVDAASAVRENQQRLLDADRAKDQFLAMLGHELRNPLSALASAAQLLQMTSPPDENARAAQAVISRQVRHMTRLIDDLLDVGRVTRGKVRLAPERLDLAEVVRAVLLDLGTGGRLREHEVRTDLESLWVDADGARIEQIVTNLLINAEKYTPPGGVIDVRVARDGADAIFEVVDSGVGLAPELLPNVFDLFVQGERSIDRSSGGLGIGLTLVKGLAELHGGSVQAWSAGQDQGSTFTVRLPAAEGPPRIPQPRRASGQRLSRRVLVVEDNEDARRSLSTALRLRGHDVEEAADGEEGLARLLEWSPEVALVDIGLPGIDGLELARRARAAGRTSGLRLIATSGYSEQEMGHRARDAGFDAYLPKPLVAPALFDLIERDRTSPDTGASRRAGETV